MDSDISDEIFDNLSREDVISSISTLTKFKLPMGVLVINVKVESSMPKFVEQNPDKEHLVGLLLFKIV